MKKRENKRKSEIVLAELKFFKKAVDKEKGASYNLKAY